MQSIKFFQYFIIAMYWTVYYSCQLEIDHVNQQPKETCQSTCSRPLSVPKNIKANLGQIIFWQLFHFSQVTNISAVHSCCLVQYSIMGSFIFRTSEPLLSVLSICLNLSGTIFLVCRQISAKVQHLFTPQEYQNIL